MDTWHCHFRETLYLCRSDVNNLIQDYTNRIQISNYVIRDKKSLISELKIISMNDSQNKGDCHCGHSLNDVTLGISLFSNTAALA